MSKWHTADEIPPMHPMYEGGPLTSGSLIVFSGHFVTMGHYQETFAKRLRRWEDSRGYVINVTHWMELPESPVTPQTEAEEKEPCRGLFHGSWELNF